MRALTGMALSAAGAPRLRAGWEWRHRGRSPLWLGAVAAVCAAIGILCGVDPKYGLLAALGLAFAAAVFANVTAGLFMFTFLSWLNAVTKGGSAVSGAKAAGLVLFLSWFAARTLRPEPNRQPLSEAHPGVTAGAVVLATWSAISVVWAHSRGVALTSTYELILDMLLFPIIFFAIRRRDHFLWILAAFVMGALVSAMIGLGQSGSRQTGALGDADQEGTLLAVALIMLVGLLAGLPRGSAARRWAAVGVPLLAVGVVNAGSRGGLLALACGLAAGTIVGGRWRSKAVAILLVAAAGTGIYLTTIAPPAASNHLSGTGSTGRTDLWKVGLRVWESHPVGGAGAGNFSSVSVDYVQEVDNISFGQFIISQRPKPVHNTYLELLADLGIPGLLAFLAIAAGSVSAALRAARTYEGLGNAGAELMSRCVGMAVIAELAGAFFITATPLKLLWVILALPFPLLAVARAEARALHPS
jgi:O-antigen ligase